MKNGFFVFVSSLVLVMTTGLLGCGSNNRAGFTVQLNNTATLAASSKRSALGPMAIATSFQVKLGGVDILRECTGGNPPGDCGNEGNSPDPDIWVNEGCGNDIAQCTPSNTEFFELIDPAAANAEILSQGRSIEPGTFSHVRVYILNNDGDDTVQCDGAPSTARPAVPVTIALAENVTVEAGDDVTVTINYDPSAVDCASTSTLTDAIAGMTATVTKQ